MMLSFGEAVRRYYRNYVNPQGRAQRSAYWWVVLYQLIIYAVLLTIIFMADGGDQLWDAIKAILMEASDPSILEDLTLGPSGIIAGLVMLCFGLSNIIPDIMLSIRRFHDLGRSGWFVLLFMGLGAIPGYGFLADIVKFVWFLLPGTDGPNPYGPDPLGPDMDIFG